MMGSIRSTSLLILLLFSAVCQIYGSEIKNGTSHWFVEGDKATEDLLAERRVLESDMKDQDVLSKVSGKERIYEEELEKLIRTILENGIPSLNVPPLDPFVHKNNTYIDDIDVPGVMTVEYLELGDFEVLNLSKFVKHSLKFDLLSLAITFNFTFPIILKANHSNFSIIVGDLIPFNGEGPANLVVDLRVECYIGLGRTPEGILRLDALSGDIFFETLEVEFSTLMGAVGGKENQIFNKLMSEVTPELIDVMKPYMMDGILESLRSAANKLLLTVELTYTDIINCLKPDPDKCPFDLP